MNRLLKKYSKDIFAFIIFTAASIFITFPLIFNLDSIVTGYGDELAYAWIFNWIIYTFTSGNFFNLLNTNIFYPFSIGIANSDPSLITAILSILPVLIYKEPIVAVNFTIVSSIIFVGFSVYLLSFYLTKNYLVSILSGFLVVFSPAYLNYFVHLQMMAVEFVPLSLLFLLKFIDSKKTTHLSISLFFLILQIYNNFIAGYFIVFSYIIILVYHFFINRKIEKLVTKNNILVLLFSLMLIVPIILPFYKVSKQYNYTRDIRDSVHFALQPEDLLYSSTFSRFHPFLNSLPFNKVSQNNEFKPGYLGLAFSILGLISLFYVFKNFKKQSLQVKSFITIALTGLVLSLGPVLHLARHTVHIPFLIPLPYALFYYIVPGFQGFRNSQRWEMMFILALAVVIAIILNKFLKLLSPKKGYIIIVFIFLAIVFEFNAPKFYNISSKNNFPPVYYFLANSVGNKKIVEMPIYNWNMFSYASIELWRMYYSTIHFKTTINGGGGFTPPPWQEMIFKLDASFPSPQAVQMLKNLGIDLIIVHKEEYDNLQKHKFKVNNVQMPKGDEVLDSLSKNNNLELIKKFNNDYVYKIK